MARMVVGWVLSAPGRGWAAVRRRPRLAAASLLGLAALLAVGGWRYAAYQWRAAQSAVDNERLEEAQQRLAFCLSVWPNSPEVHLLAARTTRLTNQLDAAEQHLNRCLQLQGGASQAVQVEFLLLRVQAGELDEVAPLLIDTVDKGHPDTPLILFTLTRAYILRLRYKMAWTTLTKWIELRPDDAKAYQWRGWVLERLANERAARADYQKAVELDRKLLNVRLRLAEMLLEDKQAPDALPELEELYRLMPNDPNVQARLGMCRALQGRPDEARRLMEAAAPHLPGDAPLLVSLANLDLQDGRGAEAERRLRAVLDKDPSDTEALYVLTSALRLQGRTTEADAVLAEHDRKKELVERTNDLLTKVADSPTAGANDYAEIGRGLLEVGRAKHGIYWLERALERDPNHQQTHKLLAAYYEQQGDVAQAAAHRGRLRGPEPPPTAAGPPPPRP